MMRTWNATWVLLGFTCLSTPAMAAGDDDFGPYMWGVGPKLGTSFLPGRYPAFLPPAIANYDFIEDGARAGAADGDNKGRDLDANGNPRFTSITQTGFDLR